MKGELTVIAGSMLGGKSLELIERVKTLKYSDISYAAFSPIRNMITSRGLTESISAIHIPGDLPGMIGYHAGVAEVQYVIIDEVQFYEPTIAKVIQDLLDNGVSVIVAGLDQTFAGKPFGSIGDLMALATEVKKKYSVCMKCKKQRATKTQRLRNGKPVPFNDPVVAVEGDSDEYTYECRCANCHEEGLIAQPIRMIIGGDFAGERAFVDEGTGCIVPESSLSDFFREVDEVMTPIDYREEKKCSQ